MRSATIARRYWEEGVRHIVALRGDPPAGVANYMPHPGGYAYAADLVRGLKDVADFDISVAAFPETHPEAQSPEQDLANLKRKLDAGATRAITQFFFDTELLSALSRPLRGRRDRCASSCPAYCRSRAFRRCCASPSAAVQACRPGSCERFDGLDDDPETRKMIAASVAIEQVARLRREGVDEFHFYTLNRAELIYAICHALGLRAK